MGKRGGSSSSNAKELKMFMKNRMWREHWYVLAAVAGIVVALFGAAVLQFSYTQDHMYRIDVTDTQLMARVFRSGEPWVVLCSKPDDIMPEVFSEAATRLTDKSFVGVLDCTQELPSSRKTVLTRYGIKTSISPTVFTVANGEKPKQIFLNYLQSAKALTKRVREQTKKTMIEVLNSAQLDSKCLQKSTCVLILRGNKLKTFERQWLDRLMAEHRSTHFAWVDSTILKLSIESMLPAYVPGDHRLVLFQRQRHNGEKKKKAIVTAKAYRNMFEHLPVGQFLNENIGSELKVLSKTPTLGRRKKKTTSSTKEGTHASKAEKESYAEKRRKERAEREKDQGDHFFSPQAADADDDGDDDLPASGHAVEEEEVIDLDAMDLDDE